MLVRRLGRRWSMSKLDEIADVWKDAIIHVPIPERTDWDAQSAFVRPDVYGKGVQVVITYLTKQDLIMIPKGIAGGVADAIKRLVSD